jgi:predicted nuclease of predicted toxin-antitoxin system
MRIFLDNCMPAKIRKFLPGHEAETAYRKGWHSLENGQLLQAAEADGYDLFLTTDTNIFYQQNLAGRKISIVVINPGDWPAIKVQIDGVLQAIESATPGGFQVVNLRK